MEEKLTCPICNRSDINLMTKHIKLHKITKEDFLKQYPGFRMQTEASRKKFSQAAEAQFKNYSDEQREAHSNNSKKRAITLNNWRRQSGYNKSTEIKEIFLKNRKKCSSTCKN